MSPLGRDLQNCSGQGALANAFGGRTKGALSHWGPGRGHVLGLVCWERRSCGKLDVWGKGVCRHLPVPQFPLMHKEANKPV